MRQLHIFETELKEEHISSSEEELHQPRTWALSLQAI